MTKISNETGKFYEIINSKKKKKKKNFFLINISYNNKYEI